VEGAESRKYSSQRGSKKYDMRIKLPDRISEKVGTFPESSYGAHLVTLILDNGTRIPHVRIAGWDEIIDDPLPGLKDWIRNKSPAF
jgi:hypothetical protein